MQAVGIVISKFGTGHNKGDYVVFNKEAEWTATS